MASPAQEARGPLRLGGIVHLLLEDRRFRDALADLDEAGRVRVWGVPNHARPLVVAATAAALQRPLLVLTAHVARARELADVLGAWLGDPTRVFLFADPESLPYERIPWSRDTRRQRLAALVALARRDASAAPPVVVAAVRALIWPTLPPRELRLHVRTLRVGDVISMSELSHLLLRLGYTAVPLVQEPGTFSRRGGILDVYPTNTRWPVRIDFFGDEIDSLRFFDPETQRTLSNEPRPRAITLGPASEALPKFAVQAATRLDAVDISTCHPALADEMREEKALLAAGNLCPHLEFYLPFFYSQPYTLLDHLPKDAVILLEDGQDFRETWETLCEQAEQVRLDALALRELPVNWPRPYVPWETVAPTFSRFPVVVLGHSDLDGRRPEPEDEALHGLFSPAPYFGGKVRHIVRQVLEVRREGGHAILISRQAPRLAALLTDAGYPTRPTCTLETPPPERGITVVHGVIPGGFIYHRADPNPNDLTPAPLWVLTDTELFGFRKVVRRPARVRATSPDTFFADVKPGDYVVHIDHGIGIFRGLVRLSLDGQTREYLLVEYAQGDKLYVPVHQADRLARYVGPEGTPPVLNRLGTADWALVKRRAKRAVAELAKELLELYALRETIRGHAFSPDTPWQQELEASFPYEETEDQLRAIEEVKRDMEKPRPMDRLVVGDVGFGKTEVAIRAAFKAVLDGKQVAVLVPTTVLALQHYRTFSERLAPFPVKVAMLSRFLSRKEQQQVLEGLRKGSIDIVIGTHRLLSDDVDFKDLGLLIIDEEQRFGVAHKEKLKKLRAHIDVLTLTATPIPRTLHMSLTGIRDLSTIETPPDDRQPIRTTVAEYDDHLVRQAIRRELDRGGQVYVVHNRVEGIEALAQHIRRLVPEARVAVAHGQMPERELERVMMQFAQGDIDVLVCTTIIENGVDIPNANTIIIHRADQFGLAQLYQLRGRVGRGAVRAYAYLLYEKGKRLSPEARRRLEAIYEASELGAGFRVALQDLELRGAGELLGARQHGHIAAVGFDLYARLLAKAVQELKERGDVDIPDAPPQPGQPDRSVDPLPPSVQMDLPLQAYLPADYIPDEWLRLQMYRRIASVEDLHDIEGLRQELIDRFGPLPEEVENLLFVVRIKVLAQRAGVQRIGREGPYLSIYTEALEEMNRSELQRHLDPDVRVGRRNLYIPLDDHWASRLEKALEMLSRR